jgi:hypothetical protein
VELVNSASVSSRKGRVELLNLRLQTSADRFASIARRLPRCTATGVLLLFGVLAYYPQWFQGAVFPWDFLGRMTTGPSYVSAAFRNFDWPTWVPYQGSGAPLDTDILAGGYYPVWWIAGLLHIPLTVTLQAKIQVLHVIFGGLGANAFVRSRGFTRRWALIAGVAFLFFGGFSGQATHAHHVRGFAFLPWILWALTMPKAGRWVRVLSLPLFGWLLIAGGYPGQAPTFFMIATAYVLVELWTRRNKLTIAKIALLATSAFSTLAVMATIVYPYVSADNDGLLYRANPPTLTRRANNSFDALEMVAVYLDQWTLFHRGALNSMAVGSVVLIGLIGLRRADLKRHLPVVAMGGTALALATLSRVDWIGERMLQLDMLFPSRFPAADAKAGFALALVLFGTLGWKRLLTTRSQPVGPLLVVVALLLYGIWLAESLAKHASDSITLVVLIIAVTAALAKYGHRLRNFAPILLLLLVVAEGGRVMADMDLPERRSPTAAWIVYLPEDELSTRDDGARVLHDTMSNPPAQRPARLEPSITPEERAHGRPVDAWGFLGLSYNMNAYGGHITTARWDALNDPETYRLMEREWIPWSMPCPAGDCLVDGGLPQLSDLRRSTSISTTRYGTEEIDYVVTIDERILMVENEINYPGWSSDNPNAQLVVHDGSLRGWVLEPGTYEFTASYSPREARTQLFLLGLAVILFFGACTIASRETQIHEPVKGTRE